MSLPRRRFPQRAGRPAFRAVLFDFDGTLTRPGAIDFAALRQLLGCPAGVPILEFIDGLGSKTARQEASRILDEYELEAARKSVPNNGAEEIVGLLRSRGISLGILSRNSLASIIEGMKRFRSLVPADFPVIISRENSGRPKPHPDGVDRAARLFGFAPWQILVVGDFVFDITAGKAAGAATAFLTNGSPPPVMEVKPDFSIDRLSELEKILQL